jgi:drug/metabolite transporter (DMT)-like permease
LGRSAEAAVPGVALVFASVAMQAAGNGVLSENLSGKESLLLSFLAFGLATLIFVPMSKGRGRAVGRDALRPLGLLNVATAVIFLSFFWSFSKIPSALAVFVAAGVAPLALLAWRYRGLERGTRAGQAVVGAITLALAVLAAVRILSEERFSSPGLTAAGLAAAVAAGMAAAAVPLLSRRLAGLGVSPTRIMAHRFHATYVIALAMLLITGLPTDTLSDGSRMAFLAIVAALGSALPLFVLQVGMHRTAPLTTALAISAVPGLTYLVAVAVGRQTFDGIAFVLVCGSLALAAVGPRLVRAIDNRNRTAALT